MKTSHTWTKRNTQKWIPREEFLKIVKTKGYIGKILTKQTLIDKK